MSAIEEETKKLALAMDLELKSKTSIIEKQAVQLRYFAAQEESARTTQSQLNQQRQARQPGTRAQPSVKNMYASGLLQRFLSASHSQPTFTKTALTSAESAQRRRDIAGGDDAPSTSRGGNANGRGTSPDADGRNVSPTRPSTSGGIGQPTGPRPSELAAAAIFSIVEVAWVRTRASCALLWLHSEHREEIVAPFVCGTEITSSRHGVRPLQLSMASSTAGTVVLTGIAVNVLSPINGHSDAAKAPAADAMASYHQPHLTTPAGKRAAVSDMAPSAAAPVGVPDAVDAIHSAVQGLTRATLVVPVFRKYGAMSRHCIGALQLVAHSSASPFSVQDEAEAANASSFLSHVISHYAGFVPEWSTRTYDASTLTKSSKYLSELDCDKGDPRHPGINAIDDGVMAVAAPMLILRTDPSSGAATGGDAQAAVARTSGASRKPISRTAVMAGATDQVSLKDVIKDIHRYTGTLEASWKRGVGLLTETQAKVEDLQRQLDLARQGINEARRQQMRSGSTATWATSVNTSGQLKHQPAPPQPRASQGGPLGMSEVEDMEGDVVGRLAVNTKALETAKEAAHEVKWAASPGSKRIGQTTIVAPPNQHPLTSTADRTFITSAPR